MTGEAVAGYLEVVNRVVYRDADGEPVVVMRPMSMRHWSVDEIARELASGYLEYLGPTKEVADGR